MVGANYWTTGITLRWDGDKWGVSLEFVDDGFCNEASTEGKLHLRYPVGTAKLPEAIDTLISDAGRLGIKFGATESVPPRLYVPGDGEWKQETYHHEWREILSRECERLGWRNPYGR